MATTITTGNATNGGASISSDNTGILELKTGTGAGTTALTVDTSQNVGIGTSSPNIQTWRFGTYLTVANASTRGQIEIDGAVADSSSASLGALIFTYSTNTTNHKDVALIEAISSGATANQRGGVLNFYTKANGTAAPALNMTLDASGTLIVGGTSSPSSSIKYYAEGTGAANRFRSTSTTASGVTIEMLADGATAGTLSVNSNHPLTFQTNSTERARFTAAGGFTCAGIYNTTVGATNRDVFVDNTGVVGYVASIREAKTNIQDLTDTSWLHQLNPVTFHYRKKDEEGNYTDETDGDIQYGMIAEDVEQVRPDLCFYDEVDGEQELRGIQYSKLVPAMLKEIQKLRAEIEALKGAA